MAKRSSIRITKTVVDSLGPGQVVWDAEVKGFGIRCQAKGKSYTLKTAVQGRTRWLTIGLHGSPWTPDSARAEAKRLLGETVQGKDPTEAKFREQQQLVADQRRSARYQGVSCGLFGGRTGPA